MGMALSMDQKVLLETGGDIITGGYSHVDGFVPFLGDRDTLELIEYFPADEVHELEVPAEGDGKCAICVVERDTFETALERAAQLGEGAKPVLVLNFAAAYSAGGGAVISPHCQEGELCRRSTLFASLTDVEARPFYDDNEEIGGSLYTDGVLLSPHVEVFRQVNNNTLAAPVLVAAISTPAPFAPGVKDLSEAELEQALVTRLGGMMKVAISNGYRDLVLGAWGCGTNQNDPALVARAFRTALDEFGGHFDTVAFAITDNRPGQPNLTAFRTQFA